MANVLFKFGTRSQFDAIPEKSEVTLYWLTDTQQLYKGDTLFGTGALATQELDGLLSAEDKAQLDALVASGIANLTSVNGTIAITDVESGKSIDVAISAEAGNVLVKKTDGLYVDASGAIDVPHFEIEKQEVAEDGYAVSYKLKKIVGEDYSYEGDVINIPKDMVLEAATLEVVTEDGVPYDGAVVGDPYIHMVFNDPNESAINVPVKDLVDTYTAGDGIDIADNVISVKIAEDSNGLVAVEGGALFINVATTDSAGAMSAVDKAALDDLISLNIAENYATKEEMQAISDRIADAEDSYTWGEM